MTLLVLLIFLILPNTGILKIMGLMAKVRTLLRDYFLYLQLAPDEAESGFSPPELNWILLEYMF
jgi:hypothetical protein